MVFKKVLSGSAVTNTPKELAEFANKASIISSSYLPHSNDLLQEPIRSARADAIKAHRIVLSYTPKGAPCNKFFPLSNARNPILCSDVILLVAITKMKSMTTHAVIVWKVIIKTKKG